MLGFFYQPRWIKRIILLTIFVVIMTWNESNDEKDGGFHERSSGDNDENQSSGKEFYLC